MANKWKVLWTEEGVWKARRYESVEGAVLFAKALKAQGFSVDVVSAGHAYPPTKKHGPRPSSMHYWCPYCIKWRAFVYRRIRLKGITGPAELRCPVCTISVRDWFVQKYNHLLDAVNQDELIKGMVTLARSND